MKKKTLILLLMINILTLSACGTSTKQPSDTAAPDTDTASVGTEPVSDADTSARTDGSETFTTDETAVTVSTNPTKFVVSYEDKTEEVTADDGTVILTSKIEIPTIMSEEAGDVAEKINQDMYDYLTSLNTSSETASWAKEDYQNSTGEDGWPFTAYSDEIYVKTPRLDDKVISFEITSYNYAGGAHGNYGSIGRNYNAQTGELITFDELSDDAAAFRAEILNYLVELANTPAYQIQLYSQDNPYSAADLEPVLLAENKWFLSTGGLTFISDPYALGPYAAGTIYFTIPYNDLENMGLRDDATYSGNYMSMRRYAYAYDMETGDLTADGTPEYSIDLNGDSTQEGIAFYGSVYSEEEDRSHISLYINGTQMGSVIEEKLDLSAGYLDSYYVLYDLDPEDSYIEIGIPYTVIEDTAKTYPEYTYFYRYTDHGELIFLGQIDGDAVYPDADFGNFRK